MWVEELPSGKYKYFERYRDTYTEKWKRVSVTLNSGSNRAKKEAQRMLDDKIAEKMASFIEYFQNDLTEKGVDISQYGFYNRDTILYISVPDDYKYYDKTDLQKFADGMLAKEHEAFNVWAAINNVNYERYPMFHIKADDGSAIASQKLNGEMKVKIK
ncbi:hypothetical protein BEN15_05165 [Streptococcus thermophilus]|nr:hypothetical protein BEN15_05165 [Streptococcus thermophilus]